MFLFFCCVFDSSSNNCFHSKVSKITQMKANNTHTHSKPEDITWKEEHTHTHTHAHSQKKTVVFCFFEVIVSVWYIYCAILTECPVVGFLWLDYFRWSNSVSVALSEVDLLHLHGHYSSFCVLGVCGTKAVSNFGWLYWRDFAPSRGLMNKLSCMKIDTGG